ncbi:hypothetical protein ACIA8K_12545 [Catenuloplanes sp. NPDC051500]|uniref:hypothetical protein n=1 Tax=Catenuloplanes sp. NPDC051500 TaxID=3363959 RepID=UPI0037A44FF4
MGLKVIIKYGKGYEDTWATFEGTVDEVRQEVSSYFDMDPNETAGLSVSALVLNATNLAHAKGNLGATLGAQAIPASTPATRPSGPRGAAAWDAADSAPADKGPSPVEHMTKRIAEIGDVDALKRLWAENQELFAAESTMMDAWKARGRALSAA